MTLDVYALQYRALCRISFFLMVKVQFRAQQQITVCALFIIMFCLTEETEIKTFYVLNPCKAIPAVYNS